MRAAHSRSLQPDPFIPLSFCLSSPGVASRCEQFLIAFANASVSLPAWARVATSLLTAIMKNELSKNAAVICYEFANMRAGVLWQVGSGRLVSSWNGRIRNSLLLSKRNDLCTIFRRRLSRNLLCLNKLRQATDVLQALRRCESRSVTGGIAVRAAQALRVPAAVHESKSHHIRTLCARAVICVVRLLSRPSHTHGALAHSAFQQLS